MKFLRVKKVCFVSLVLLLAAPFLSFAEMKLQTPDGKTVLLKDNGTWEYVSSSEIQNLGEYRPVDIDDFKVDFESLRGKKIMVQGEGTYVGDNLMLGKGGLDMNPVFVEIKNLPRDQMKHIVKNCSEGSPIKVFGVVAEVLFQKGIIADKIEW